MAEYLNRDALLKKLDERLKALRKANWPWDRYITGFEDAVEMVEYFAPADVVEVRHGEWEYHDTDENDMVIVKCSACGRKQYGGSSYCPNCGAKMDGKGEGE